MKKIILLIIAAVTMAVTGSCKKSSSDFVVEYKITPINSYVVQFSYNDASGGLATVDNMSQLSDGIKDVSVSKKPFDALLKIETYNTTAATIYYTLTISVNGVVKSFNQIAAPPMVPLYTAQIEYMVN
jgi:hypothetical protein